MREEGVKSKFSSEEGLIVFRTLLFTNFIYKPKVGHPELLATQILIYKRQNNILPPLRPTDQFNFCLCPILFINQKK